jgi:hypothetical protein
MELVPSSDLLKKLIEETQSAPDPKTVADVKSLDERKAEAEIDNYKQNTKERKKYADLIWQFTCFWCVYIGAMLFLCGIKKIFLSDLVITALIGSTTVTLTGFFLLVTQYLFNKDKST